MPNAAEAAPPRRRLGAGRIPAPLGAILLATALIGVTWALLVPPWQSPDETVHFAYAQSLATRFALPGDKRRSTYSTAQAVADAAVGAGREAFYPAAVPPDWSHADDARYRAALPQHPSASDGGGPNTASANPPLYYLYADLAYWLIGGNNAFHQLYAMRIWDLVLLLTAVTAGWLLAGEVFERRRDVQLVCAAVAGLVPAETFVSTSVNPDALMVALWSLALWLGARVIVRGGQRRNGHLLRARSRRAVGVVSRLAPAADRAAPGNGGAAGGPGAGAGRPGLGVAGTCRRARPHRGQHGSGDPGGPYA